MLSIEQPHSFTQIYAFVLGMLSQFSHVRLCDPVDCSPPGSSVHGIFQEEYWSGLPWAPPEDLPNPGIEPKSLTVPVSAGWFFTTSAIFKREALSNIYVYILIILYYILIYLYINI